MRLPIVFVDANSLAGSCNTRRFHRLVVVVAIFLYFSVDFFDDLLFLPIEFVFDFIRNGKRRENTNV